MNGRTNLKTCLVTGVLLLSLVAGQLSADPNQIAHYTFDDGDASVMINDIAWEDFESYDFVLNIITFTWVPGLFTGAVIDLGTSGNGDPVYGGSQSMIYEYDNVASGWNWYSETYRDFGGSPQDWSYATGDVKSLQLNFYGETGNDPDVMYVVLEDSNTNNFMKLYDGDMDDLKAGEWKEWDIALSDFTTVHLGYIKTVYIGFGARGASGGDPPSPLAGTVYFDDFRVYTSGILDYVPGQSYFGRNSYIEYIAGNLPIIMSAPHGGSLLPSEIPDRTWGLTGTDSNVDDLARTFSDEMYSMTGRYPHIIICHLRRLKLDANREIGEAAQGNQWAEYAWHEWHDFINDAEDSVIEQSGSGNYIDLHGQSHPIQRLELGYLLSSSTLELNDAAIEDYNEVSSIRTLSHTTDANFAELLRGQSSFGELMEARGFPSVPSPNYPDPGGNPYYTGGYNTRQHSSRHGGMVSGFQIECNYTGVRDTEANRILAAQAMAESHEIYLAEHYGIDINSLSMSVLRVVSENWLSDSRQQRLIGELVGWWTFDDGTANDSSGNGHHGTLVQSGGGTSVNIVYDGDRDSNVLELNNPASHTINSVVDCGGDVSDGGWADISGGITTALWVKVDTLHISSQYLLTKGAAYQVTRYSTTARMRSYMAELSDTELTSSTTDIDDGQWHHVAVTYDSNEAIRKIYIDGQESNRDRESGPLTIHTESFVIGGRLNSSFDDRGWDGRVDDVRLYDYALNADEIGLVYAGTTLPPPQPELACYHIPNGDLNQDCKIDSVDFSILASRWFDGPGN